MKKSADKRGHGPSRLAFKLRPVAAGCAVFISAMAGSAFAQQAEPVNAVTAKPADTSVVVVKGIRRGIEDAISVKKDSTSIVESISAEDIGKLPDSSIAESIARLPGLTAQRVDGRASTISIRGLPGDFSSTLLNGREQASTGDNRSVEYDQYPSELMSAVTVHKTSDASLIGQGLSGTVNLQTVSPLAFPKRTIAVNLRGERNSNDSLNAGTSANGKRFSISYIDQFMDRKLGLAIGYAHLDSPGQSTKWNAWGYNIGGNNLPGVAVLGGSETYATSKTQKRDGLMAVVEFKPNRTYSSVIDAYYSKFDKVEKSNITKTGLSWSGATLSNPQIGDVEGSDVKILTGGTFTGVKPVLQNNLDVDNDKLFAIGWNNKFKVSDKLSFQADLSMSSADRDDAITELYSGTVGVTDTFQVSNIGPGGVPQTTGTLNYADPALIRLNDSGGWNQDGFVKFPQVTDDLKSLRLSGKYELDGMFTSVDFGLNYSEREKTRQSNEFFLDLKASPTTIPANLLTAPTSHAFAGLGDVIAYDAQGAYDTLYNLRRLIHQDVFNKDWEVTEKVTTGYAKLNIDTEVGSIPVRGNVGLQIVRTDQSSEAFAANSDAPAGPATAHGGKSYTDVLPSANVALSFENDQTLRFGLAKTIARPRLDDLRASSSSSIDRTKLTWSGKGGNPELDPWEANAFDVSYEKYFGKVGYVSLAGFYKDLKTYIYKQKVARDFTGSPTNGLVARSNIGEFEQPMNGEGGKMQGAELTVSVPGSLLTPVLDGFGASMNYARTSTSISPNGPGTTEPLPGFSKNVSNLTLYYEKHGFSTRVSQRKRSDYVGEVSGFGADRALVYIKAETVTDFQLGYEFEKGALKGMSLLFQINNVTDEPYQTYYVKKEAPKEYVKHGRQFLFGINYKM